MADQGTQGENSTEGALLEERARLQRKHAALAAGPERTLVAEALDRVERRIRKRHLPLLGRVRVAAPCPEQWGEMTGGDKQRYCNLCEKDVHNLSAMTTKAAEEFLRATKSQDVCVTYYRRRDGKIMTRDCAPGVSRRKSQRRRSAVAAVGGSALAAGMVACGSGHDSTGVVGQVVSATALTPDHPPEMGEPSFDGDLVMGDVAYDGDDGHVCDESCDHAGDTANDDVTLERGEASVDEEDHACDETCEHASDATAAQDPQGQILGRLRRR